jgi:hypothetical protein
MVLELPERVADHLSPFSAEDKNDGAIPPLPPNVFISWYLIKHRNKFIMEIICSYTAA